MMAPQVCLITSKQAAAILGIAHQTLAVWRCKQLHNLPWAKIGRKVMYDKNEVLGFIANMKTLQNTSNPKHFTKTRQPVKVADYF